MRKTAVIVALVLLAGLFIAGTASTWCTWGGYGGWSRGGYGTRYGTVDTESFRSFQKDTLSLREEMIAKDLELQNEYNKPTPDPKRIATLEKEAIDLQTKIQEVADKYGLSAWGPMGGYAGRGMMGPGRSCTWGNW
jgi:zinc resistance-associated protein